MFKICDPQHVSPSASSRRRATVSLAGKNGSLQVRGLPALTGHIRRSRGAPLVDGRLAVRWDSRLRCEPSQVSLSTEEEAQSSSSGSAQSQRRQDEPVDSLKSLESLNSLAVEDSARAPQNEQTIRQEAGPSQQTKQSEPGEEASTASANGHAEATSSEKPGEEAVSVLPYVSWLRSFLGRVIASFLAVFHSVPWISRRKRLKQLTTAWESDKINTDKYDPSSALLLAGMLDFLMVGALDRGLEDGSAKTEDGDFPFLHIQTQNDILRHAIGQGHGPHI